MKAQCNIYIFWHPNSTNSSSSSSSHSNSKLSRLSPRTFIFNNRFSVVAIRSATSEPFLPLKESNWFARISQEHSQTKTWTKLFPQIQINRLLQRVLKLKPRQRKIHMRAVSWKWTALSNFLLTRTRLRRPKVTSDKTKMKRNKLLLKLIRRRHWKMIKNESVYQKKNRKLGRSRQF